jgi:hypothetical protein
MQLMIPVSEQALDNAAALEREATRILKRREYSAFSEDGERFWFGETRVDRAARHRRHAQHMRDAAKSLRLAGL